VPLVASGAWSAAPRPFTGQCVGGCLRGCPSSFRRHAPCPCLLSFSEGSWSAQQRFSSAYGMTIRENVKACDIYNYLRV